ncbi:MAG TPA: low temperature requirement protein A [Streptosporangiaceae bacterium]
MSEQMPRWIELFYDLIFVAALLIFSVAVGHVHPSSGIIWLVLVFAALWWVWFMTTACANRSNMADLPHRLLLLFQMLVIVLMAMEARVSVVGDSAYLAAEYGLLLLTVSFMYFRAARLGGSSGRGYAMRLAVLNAVSAACLFVAVPLPESGRLILSAASLVLLVIPSIVMFQRTDDLSGSGEGHLLERMGAFTLIVCGEAFVEIAISVSDASLDTVNVTALIFEFILVFALFTSYFDDIPAAGLNQRRFAWWTSLHLVTQIGIAGTAVSAYKLINLHISHRLPDFEILWLTATLAIIYLALAGVGVCTRRRPAGPLAAARVITAASVATAGVAAWQIPWIRMAEALPIFAAIVVIHAFVAVRLRIRTRVIDATALHPVVS